MRLTCVELHFSRTVFEVVSRDQHLAVDILSTLTDVGGESEEETNEVETEFIC